MSGTVPSLAVRAMVEGMRAVGLDAARIVSKSGISEFSLEDGDARIPEVLYVNMWREARQVARSDAIGVDVGMAVPVGVLGPIDYLASTVNTVGESIVCTRDFGYLTADSSYWEIENGPKGELIARFVNAVPGEEDDVGDEFVFGVLMGRTLAWAGAPVDFSEFQLTRRKPLRRLNERFAGRVSYGHARSQVVLGSGAAFVPLKRPDPYLHAMLRTLLRESGRGQSAVPNTVAMVRGCVRGLLGQAMDLSVVTVARQLGFSPRTLQRKLGLEGTCFEQIVNDARRDMAMRLLREQPRLSILSVALQVGFADERVLARAFRRWTGLSPRGWRDIAH